MQSVLQMTGVLPAIYENLLCLQEIVEDEELQQQFLLAAIELSWAKYGADKLEVSRQACDACNASYSFDIAHATDL